MKLKNLSIPCLLLALACLLPAPARAIDGFEVQVYETDVSEPGQFGLEVHTNYTPVGKRKPEYAGHIAPHGVGRMTLEPAIGVTDFLELGAYLQFIASPDAGMAWGGAKVRAKFVVPERLHLPVHLGLNIELGKVPHAIEENGWANEFRPIIAWTDGVWLFDINPIFGYALTGKEAFKPDFEPAGKVAWNTQRGFALGIEYYTGLGLISEGLSTLRDQEHIAFATFDLAAAKDGSADTGWELNFGVGRGLTDATGATWEVKSIVGKAF